MTRWLLVFLIALLPLRGWAVERMAYGFERTDALAHLAMPEDCAQHGALHQASDESASADPADPDAIADASAHTGCQQCQLCMPLAALEAAPALPIATPSKALPPRGAQRFVSADLVRDAKPPIS